MVIMKKKEYNTICRLIVEKICEEKSKNYFFESIIGCEPDFLKCMDIEFYNNDVYIRVLYRDKDENDISEVLKIRNNKKIKKCIVLTNRSLKVVDSLKDIGEDTVDALIDVEVLRKYIEKLGMSIVLDSRYSKFCEFLDNLISCIKPEMGKIIDYLEKVNDDYILSNNTNKMPVNERLALAANQNLYLFSIWASASKTFLTKGKINKIYMSSKPVNIHKRINSIEQLSNLSETTVNMNKRGLRTSSFAKSGECKKILFEMLCMHEYQDAYRQVYYEYVEQLLGKKNKVDDKRDGSVSEVEMKYVDIYWLALQYLVDAEFSCSIDINSLSYAEKEEDSGSSDENLIFRIKDSGNREYTHSIPYSTNMIDGMEKELEKRFSWKKEEQNSRRDRYMEYWYDVMQLCQNLNISKDIREKIKKKIGKYGLSWSNFKNRECTPGKFQDYLSASEKTYESFYDLVRYIMVLDVEIRKKIASSGLLERIVNIDMKWNEESLYISCYNPLLIFYLWQINNRNYTCFEYCNKGKGNLYQSSYEHQIFDYQLRFLEEYNQMIPNDIIQIDGIKYMHVLDNRKYRFPYYLRYKPVDSIASFAIINLLETIQYVNEYIWENLYKNTIRICLIGDIHFESVPIYIKKLEKLGEKEAIRKFNIQIVTKGANSKNIILEEILGTRQGYGKNIEVKIESLNSKQYRGIRLGDYIAGSDIVFLLDSSFMYHEAEYHVEKQNNIRNIVRYQTLEKEKEYLGLPTENGKFSMPVIPDVINCFQNASEELELRPGKWDKYTLNMKPMMDIINEMRMQTEEDKTVVFFSSDENLDRKIENEDFLKTIKEGRSGNKKLKIIVWKSTEKRSKADINQKGKGYIEINLTGILDTFLSEETLDPIWKNGRTRIYYRDFPKQIEIRTWYPEFRDDDSQREKVQQVIVKYIISVLNNQFWLPKMIREIVLQNLWNCADSLEDLVFVYALKKHSSVTVSYRADEEIESKNSEFYIPPSQKKIWNNNVLQFFEILEKERFNGEMAKELDALMKRDSCQIKLDDCGYIAKTLKRYLNDEQSEYIITNLKEYIGGNI